MIKSLLFLILLPLQLLAFDLKQEVHKATAGDFVVYAYKQSLLLLRIAAACQNELTIEEISAPLSAKPTNWQEWLQRGAPNHSSWTLSRIDLINGKVEAIFSADEKKYLSSNPAFQFLPTLFQLSLKPIEPALRKYIGPEPMPGESDRRRLWFPKIIFEGKEIHPVIQAYHAEWPKDESELSGKPLDIYLPQNGGIPYMPYWIEVPGGLTKAKISAIDSGKNLQSPLHLETYEQVESKGM